MSPEVYAVRMISLGLSNFAMRDRPQPPVEALRALGETATWCTRGPLRADGLRSSLLAPISILCIPTLDERGIEAFVNAKRDSYEQAVESIRRRRSELLNDAVAQPVDPAEAQRLGKLLLYNALETVDDGAAGASSHGFFDMEDAPPWDTWFWHDNDTIFC